MSENPFERLAKGKRTKSEQEEYQRGYDDYMREHSVSPYEQGRRDAEQDLARREWYHYWERKEYKDYEYFLDRAQDHFGFWRIT